MSLFILGCVTIPPGCLYLLLSLISLIGPTGRLFVPLSSGMPHDRPVSWCGLGHVPSSAVPQDLRSVSSCGFGHALSSTVRWSVIAIFLLWLRSELIHAMWALLSVKPCHRTLCLFLFGNFLAQITCWAQPFHVSSGDFLAQVMVGTQLCQ